MMMHRIVEGVRTIMYHLVGYLLFKCYTCTALDYNIEANNKFAHNHKLKNKVNRSTRLLLKQK